MNDSALTNNENIATRTSNRLRGARSEVRPGELRDSKYEPFRPRGVQEVPAALRKKLELDGYHLRWGRITIQGEVDSENLAELAHKGFEPVYAHEVPENILNLIKVSDVAGFKGLIVSKDSALFKLPKERRDEIRAYFSEIADSQLRGVHQQIRQNAAIHGLDVKLMDESKSEVAYGEKARQVVAQDDNSD
jgi:hypothetical protein